MKSSTRLETLESIISRLRGEIKTSGLKNSKQREEIINVLYSSNTHMSPEEIILAIRTKDKSASLSSVYRILAYLERSGFITSLETDKSGRRYEIASKEHHDHIVCVKCGDIIEFNNEQIERLQEEITLKLGARLISHDMRLFVECKKCQKKRGN